MKLLLTSAGWEENPKIAKKFLELLSKSPSETKILVIIQTEEDEQWLDSIKNSLMKYKISEGNIRILNAEHRISYKEARNYDVIYFCGGNTFYLLDRIRKTGFDEIIKKFVKELDKVYFGVSAGSIIMGPDIKISSIDDENEVGLKDLTGLNIINIIISPHYCKEERETVKKFKKNSKYKVVPLTDKQALLVIDDKIKIIV